MCTSLIIFISPSNPRRRGADPGTAPPPARRPRGHPCRRLVARGHAARRRSRPRRPPAAVCLADDGGWPPKLSDLSLASHGPKNMACEPTEDMQNLQMWGVGEYCKCVYIYIYIISLYNLALGYLGMMVRILTNQQVELSNRIMTEFIERQHGF